jgi:large subunit ribosomal protein L13
MKKTFSIKPSEVTREWVVIDASEAPLGRVATTAAKRLIGKHKPTYTAHIDGGDYVIVINADKLVVTGDKETGKIYYRHSGFPSGITATTLAEQRIKDPTKVIVDAVKGMLPKNKLVSDRLIRLKVYAGPEHTHAPQQPVKIKVNE